nr:hypothetical protein [Litoribacterium kuwaitense]
MIDILKKQIPLIHHCKDMTKINKGFSSDEKYLIHMPGDNNNLLLRMFNIEELESKKMEYSILEKMQAFKINCSVPISFGEAGKKDI